ncbi:MAG TPA: hypothetical protein VHC40_02820 [Rhizomicrobium sp.]|nr:hypothetical protein [Rhizomicrobium sp.]
MDETAAPRAQPPTPQRDAFRAFMLSHRLCPTGWARAAGIAPAEILAFLTGHTRGLSPDVLQKLAAAAGVGVQDIPC